MNFDKEKCDEWEKIRLNSSPKNPFTKRNVKKDGPTYKKIDLICRHNVVGGNVVDLNKLCLKWLKDNHPNVKIPKSKSPPKVKSPKRKKSPVRRRVSSPLLTDDEDDVLNLQYDYLLSYRSVASEEITNYLRQTINDKTITAGNACMSNTKTLLKYFTNVKAVGKGSFGTVYIGNINIKNNVFSIAIKEGQISGLEANRAKKLQFPVEYLFNQMMNNILNNKMCPSFNYTYCIHFCDHCEVVSAIFKNPKTKSKITTCSVTMVEKADSDLIGLTSLDAQLSALFQILAAVHCIHKLYGIQHCDIKIENVLKKNIPKQANEYFRYSLDGVNYFVPNTGFVAILNDFGVSFSTSPKISTSYFGVRNAKVVFNNNSYKFQSFTTQRYPQENKWGKIETLSPPPRLRGPGGAKLTLNKFMKNFDSKPSIFVDLEDFQKFPTFGMYQDIQDVVRMFVGGKQTVQPGSHTEMRGLQPQAKKAILPFVEKLAPTSIWPEDKVELFLANVLIHKIFTQFGYTNAPPNAIILETYKLP
ncbi:hypothetical protein IIV6-T1_373 [Invertebrate iridescent virus 6]|nr:hypothetical protein IIV6-T1_373 [Invertebrate iridescent virus 6]